MLASDVGLAASDSQAFWDETENTCLLIGALEGESTVTLASSFTSATKELWVAPNIDSRSLGDWRITPNGNARFLFGVPVDLQSVTGAVVVAVANSTTSTAYDLSVSAASSSESYETAETQFSGVGPITTTQNELIEIDISSMIPASVEAGVDSLSITFSPTQLASLRIVGLRFFYEGSTQPTVDSVNGLTGGTINGGIDVQGGISINGSTVIDSSGQFVGPLALNWADLTNIPGDLADGDDDTTYTAGSGILLNGTEFSLDQALVEALIAQGAFTTEAEVVAAIEGLFLPTTGGSVGELEVTGQLQAQTIKLGSTTSPADASTVGTIAYDLNLGKLIVSNGTEWVPLALDVDPGYSPIRFGTTYPGSVNLVYGNFQTVKYDEPLTSPVVVATIDETMDDNGGATVRLRRNFNSQFSVRTNEATDGLQWMAVDEGIHEIDGKMIQAGSFSGSVSGSNTISFNATFDQPPIIFLMIDESVDDVGAAYNIRVIGTPQTNQFDVWINAAADNVHWIAMEPGEYVTQDAHWYVGSQSVGSTTGTIAFPTTFSTLPGVVTTMRDTNNSGGTWNRLTEVTPTTFSYRINTSGTEFLNYIAFESI
ncbi:hypothetical protein C5Y96_02965 [Blastopirellula marina]|uniref:Uncharacterized protein n=1 Tax=Blastopirellula marina TaxID=124 RepID=A0A2S8G340_9BACT|nr:MULTISPECIES: hypothetical protein [Pirellulaceae]PQO38847.1 hypothetical protein C5Y96_02965 [Blastopirellula marina]RCS55155.1 hypothetical protein DTL36_02970 [Bremerella cremea]